MSELSDNERLLIQLQEQLKHTNENHKKIIDLTKEIFVKIDSQSKEVFQLKSKLETLTETEMLKYTEINKQLNDVKSKENTDVIAIERGLNEMSTRFKDFKKDDFHPLSNDIQKAKGALVLIKYVYPAIAILMQIVSVVITISLKSGS